MKCPSCGGSDGITAMRELIHRARDVTYYRMECPCGHTWERRRGMRFRPSQEESAEESERVQRDRLLDEFGRSRYVSVPRQAGMNRNADEFASAQPTTAPVLGGAYERMDPPKIADAPLGLAGQIEDSYMREDGVRVITDFKMMTVSLVDEDQLLDLHCRINVAEAQSQALDDDVTKEER